ncbi:MAG: leucyl aminopeptidase, partial [Oligoflexia bacterium]|nr:leucyl aminopeptidase [Oligoflexia bacterium]
MDFLTTGSAAPGIACDLLAIGVGEGQLDAALAWLGAPLATDLAVAAKAEDFDGKTGTVTVWPSLGRVAAARIGLVGLGQGDIDDIRRAAGAAGFAARKRGASNLVLRLGDLDTPHTIAAIEGIEAGNYRYDRYQAESDRKAPLQTVAFAGTVDQDAIALARAIAQGQRLARDLVNAPAAEIFPESLASEAAALASDGLVVDVWDLDRIKAAGMGGIVAVGQGSTRPGRFVHMSWQPAGPARKKLVMVGKGVTFDSGGLSLKPSAGMQTMRCDMGGSAAVIGAMKVVAELHPDVEVHGIFGAVENMNSGDSYKLGDILTMHN